MAIALRSRSLMESLPDEILERIFSYCSLKDLVESFQDVSIQWRRVSQSPSLWKQVQFKDSNESHRSVVEVLEMSPSIQTVIFTKSRYRKALQTLTKCSNLRRVLFSDFQRVTVRYLKVLQAKCPMIEYLRLPINVLTVPKLCEAVGRFTNLKTLELGRIRFQTDSFINLKPIATNCPYLECINFWDNKFQLEDLQQFLTMKKATLRSIGLTCSNLNHDCVLPLLLDLPALRYLHLYCFSLCEYEAKCENLCNLKTVTNLTFEEVLRIEADDIIELFRSRKMAHLRYVNLRGFYQFNTILKDTISQNCPLLVNVNISSI